MAQSADGVVSEIGGVPVAQIVGQFGTPSFVYEQALIERQIARLKKFPIIRYAQKANSNLAILALMRQHGVLVDAVSAGEVERALRVGYRPHQIVFTADIFDHPVLDLLEQYPSMGVNCGSPDMISQLGQRCPNRDITLRINPGFGHGHSQKTNTGGEQSKHGIWHEQLGECLASARAHQLTVTGLHMHIGSGTDFEHLAQVVDSLKSAALQVGTSLHTISTGGGLPTPYKKGDPELDIDAYAELWLNAQRELEQELGQPLNLEVEPGRYLVAEAGHLVAEIRAIKEMGSNRFYLLNAGFNNLARPILYGAYHGMSVCPHDDRSDSIGELDTVVIGGPLCESGDIFTQAEGGYVEARTLPKAKVGDWLIIHGSGAYSFTMGSNYNSMPLACEVLIADQKAHLIRARQTIDDLLAGEEIPEWLSDEKTNGSTPKSKALSGSAG